MHKILFTGGENIFTKEELEKLKKLGLEITIVPPHIKEQELIKILQNYEAVIVNGEEYYTENILKQCENLKVIQFFGIGYQKCIDMEIANKYGKIIANTPKVNSYSVAEFTLGLIFALNQKIIQHNEETKKGNWREKSFFDLKDKTIGIIGMGHIGSYFANIMYNAFHANILYYDKENKLEQEKNYYAKRTSLEELMEKSDVVSLHLPLTDSTRNLIGEKELFKMKETAYFINTARAEIVDAEALYKLLKNNKIAGCAFDGFYSEPINLNSKEAKLLTLPNGKFLLTPHTGYNAVEGLERVKKMCIENLIQILNNNPCQNVINKEVIEKE